MSRREAFSILGWCGRFGRGILVLFTVLFPFKFGLPFTYNIDPSVPRDIIQVVFLGWPPEWGMVMLLSSGALLLFSKMKEKSDRIYFNYLDLAVLSFFSLVMVNAAIHGLTSGGIETSLLLCSYGLYYFLLKFYFPQLEDRRTLLKWVFLSFVFLCLYGFYQFHQGLDETLKHAEEIGAAHLKDQRFLTRISVKKVFATFIYSNSFAAYLIMLIPLFLGTLFWGSYKKLTGSSWILGGLLFLITFTLYLGKTGYLVHYVLYFGTLPLTVFYLLFLTQSKGAILSLLAGYLLSLPFLSEKVKKMLPMVVVLFLILIGLGSIKYSFISKLSGSFNVRKEYGIASFRLIRENPLWGFGAGSYGTHYMRVKEAQAEEVQLAHNDYLQVWVELGFLAFIAFLVMVLLPFRAYFGSGHKQDPLRPFLVWSLMAATLHRGIDFDFYVPALGFLTVLLIQLFPDRDKRISLSFEGKSLFFSRLALLFTSGLFLMIIFRIIQSQIYFEIGKELRDKKQIPWAFGAYSNSVEFFPYIPKYYIHMSDCLFQMGEFSKAETSLEKAISINPKNGLLWYQLALLKMQHDGIKKNVRGKEVLDALKKAAYLFPTNQEISRVKQAYSNYLLQLQNK